MEANPKKDYLGTALADIDELLLSTLGYERGCECAELFALHLERETREGRLTKEVLSGFISKGLWPKDAGLCILDQCVSNLKEVSNSGKEDLKLTAFITDFEKVIDRRMKADPANILPRNGAFASAAEASGFDKWFRPLS